MSRRIVAAIVAGILALLSAAILVSYVNGSQERAMAEMDPVEVLVVTAPIAQGTPAEEIADSVATAPLPEAAVGPQAVTSLADLAGLVALTDLQPDEQVLAGRFGSPRSLGQFGGIAAPEGLHQVTVALDSPRVVGGTVRPGDLVGVFISLPADTHLTIHKVLVTRVQGGLSAAMDTGEDGEAPLPEGAIMVTLAVNARDAEAIVFAAEHASIWLSLVDSSTSEDGTRIVNPENVHQ